ncbi:hypothetical protein DL89DRAFT_289591 [Linderina pennispora]|uniref:ORC6 second cyclin-like domain-containing protein n=1 Tax=Linderina pennispora TaxID=61395 RepID=A0A1Y1WKJ7_9FUNG|nr:uncharacterized protein DL89DRAFT_289591 [Linderina pennispora]ORX73905.1 hypothetical protein DL89DRAFT_289591 [Linderina pennispora]
MSIILAERLKSLQLDGQPGIAPKALQFYDMITQRVRTSRNSSFTLCRETIAIQLACEKLSIEFNQVAASTISSVSLPIYQASVQEARAALGLIKNITLEELDVQFGPPEGVIPYARQLLDEFKETLGATMPAAARRSMDWSGSVYVAAAFALACKHMKKRVVAKTKLLSLAGIKPTVFAGVQKKMEDYGKKTLQEIAAGGGAMAKAQLWNHRLIRQY